MSVPAPYPNYTRPERYVDACVHLIGICGAIGGMALFLALHAHHIDWGLLIAMGVYELGLLLMLTASATYHILAHTRYRPILRRFDHAAIFLKIAATITPLAIILGTRFAYTVLALIWVLASVGAVIKMKSPPGKMGISCWPYLALGWLGILIIVPLYEILPQYPVQLILTGGGIYSAAVIFFWWDSLPYANAIWHGCVVAASACFFGGITIAAASI